MSTLDLTLQDRLQGLDQQHLRRRLHPAVTGPSSVRIRRDGREFLNFSSNDYLGLARDPELAAAMADAAGRWGSGSGASRLVCGSLEIHHELERDLARLKGTEAALAFSTGYATALGTIPALVGSGDLIVLDRLAHACLVDGARLSGAAMRVFRHNDPQDLRRILEKARADRDDGHASVRVRSILVITESVFSMDGDCAPLREIVEITDAFDAWLLVDEAHATGVLGEDRGGLISALGLQGRIDITMGTLGKALGTAGGFIAGSRTLCDFLVNAARSFLFSTAPPPGVAAASRAAVARVLGPDGAALQATLWDRVHQLQAGLRELGWTQAPAASPIRPLIVGPEEDALRLSQALAEAGILAPAIRYPTVKRGQARVRLTVSAAHTPGDVEQLLSALRPAMERTGIRPA